jgi:hypothetical protein
VCLPDQLKKLKKLKKLKIDHMTRCGKVAGGTAPSKANALRELAASPLSVTKGGKEGTKEAILIPTAPPHSEPVNAYIGTNNVHSSTYT